MRAPYCWSSFTGSGLFVLMSQCGNINELALRHVPCDRFLQKPIDSATLTTAFPGSPPSRPLERERERPWKTLVRCLQESGR